MLNRLFYLLKNENTIFIESIPFQFGYSKYNAKNYPYSDLYTQNKSN